MILLKSEKTFKEKNVHTKKLSIENKEEIKKAFTGVFTKAPWYDNWSDTKQLDLKQIFLLTDSNVPAYEFYKKNGFVECETNVAFAKML